MSKPRTTKHVARLVARDAIELDLAGVGYDIAMAPDGDAFAVAAGGSVTVYRNAQPLWTREVGTDAGLLWARDDLFVAVENRFLVHTALDAEGWTRGDAPKRRGGVFGHVERFDVKNGYVVTSSGREITLWDRPGRSIASFTSPEEPADLEVAETGRVALVSGGRLFVGELGKSALVQIADDARCVAVDRTGEHLAWLNSGHALLIGSPGQPPRHELSLETVAAVAWMAWSPGATALALLDHASKLWLFETNRKHARLVGSASNIDAFAFVLARDRLMALAAEDGHLSVHDLVVSHEPKVWLLTAGATNAPESYEGQLGTREVRRGDVVVLILSTDPPRIGGLYEVEEGRVYEHSTTVRLRRELELAPVRMQDADNRLVRGLTGTTSSFDTRRQRVHEGLVGMLLRHYPQDAEAIQDLLGVAGVETADRAAANPTPETVRTPLPDGKSDADRRRIMIVSRAAGDESALDPVVTNAFAVGLSDPKQIVIGPTPGSHVVAAVDVLSAYINGQPVWTWPIESAVLSRGRHHIVVQHSSEAFVLRDVPGGARAELGSCRFARANGDRVVVVDGKSSARLLNSDLRLVREVKLPQRVRDVVVSSTDEVAFREADRIQIFGSDGEHVRGQHVTTKASPAALAMSRGASMIAIASSDGVDLITADGSVMHYVVSPSAAGAIVDIKFDENGEHIGVCTDDGTLSIIDINAEVVVANVTDVASFDFTSEPSSFVVLSNGRDGNSMVRQLRVSTRARAVWIQSLQGGEASERVEPRVHNNAQRGDLVVLFLTRGVVRPGGIYEIVGTDRKDRKGDILVRRLAFDDTASNSFSRSRLLELVRTPASLDTRRAGIHKELVSLLGEQYPKQRDEITAWLHSAVALDGPRIASREPSVAKGPPNSQTQRDTSAIAERAPNLQTGSDEEVVAATSPGTRPLPKNADTVAQRDEHVQPVPPDSTTMQTLPNSTSQRAQLGTEREGGAPPLDQPVATAERPRPLVIDTLVNDEKRFVTLTVRGASVEVQWADERFLGRIERPLAELERDAEQGTRLYERVIDAKPPLDGAPNVPADGIRRAFSERAKLIALEVEPSLHRLRWEAMGGELGIFGLREDRAIARVSPGSTKPPVSPPLNIVVAVAAPAGLGVPGNDFLYKLAKIDREQEIAAARTAFEPLVQRGLANLTFVPGTAAALTAAIADRAHVLHLVAHGFWDRDSPRYGLVLERDATGAHQNIYLGARGQAGTLADIFAAGVAKDGGGNDLRLVTLSCCYGSYWPAGDGAAVVSLGARLAEHVPSVVAMQDAISMEHATWFAREFYYALARNGDASSAAAAARLRLRQQFPESDAWSVPVVHLGHPAARVIQLDANARGKVAKDLEPLRPMTAQERAISVAAQTAGVTAPISHAVAAAVQEAVRSAAPGFNGAGWPLIQDRADLSKRITRPVDIDPAEVGEVRDLEDRPLSLPESVLVQAAAALTAGKHVIFIGPPGTGKTTLTGALCRWARQRRMITGATYATASADWSTFETVGGLVPGDGGGLIPRAGLVLGSILRGEWLVIDEINRAEIDKAFGELFTLLSGQPVTLPFGARDTITVRPPRPGARRGATDISWPTDAWCPDDVATDAVVVHPNWRILATMNVYDRSFLFSMSLAFMRRFAFVDVELPDDYDSVIGAWVDSLSLLDADRNGVTEVLSGIAVAARGACPVLCRHRALGPAIISDVLAHTRERLRRGADWRAAVGEGVALYVVPQLEGLSPGVVQDIDKELRGVFPDSKAVSARLRGLYPHVEWGA